MIKKDGLLSFYKGLRMALIATIASYGSYFFGYRLLKNVVTSLLKIDESKLNSGHITLITALAGSSSSAFANPFWLVNTRMTLAQKKTSIRKTIKEIY